MKKNLIIAGEHSAKVCLILVIVFLAYYIAPLLMPVILSIFAAIVLDPVIGYITRVRIFKRHIPKEMAILSVLLVCALLLAAFSVFLLKPLLAEINNIMQALPQIAVTVQSLSEVWFDRLSHMDLPSTVQDMLEKALNAVSAYILTLLRNMLQTTVSFATNILSFIIVPILIYYFLKDGSRFRDGFILLFPKEWHQQTRDILEESRLVLGAYGRGVVVIGLISGIVIGIGTYVIGLDYPYVFAVLAILAEAVPIIGAIFSALPAMFFASMKGTDTLIIVTLFYLIYHQIDAYVITPRISGKLLDMHPLVIIISIFIGGKLSGAIGMLFAVPVVALIRVLIRHIMFSETLEKNR